MAPDEFRRQLKLLGLSRFRREVMPEEWRNPLRDTMLALATPYELVTRLEQKLSSTKAGQATLKHLRKLIPPVA